MRMQIIEGDLLITEDWMDRPVGIDWPMPARGPLKHCCICRHFRMFKPEKEYCTAKKAVVNPLAENELCWELRKGLRFVDGSKS